MTTLISSYDVFTFVHYTFLHHRHSDLIFGLYACTAFYLSILPFNWFILEWLITFASMYYFFLYILNFTSFFCVPTPVFCSLSFFHLPFVCSLHFTPNSNWLHGSAAPPPMHYGFSWPSPSLNCLGWKNTSTQGWQFLPAGNSGQTGAFATYPGWHHMLTVQPHTNPAAAETFPRPRIHQQHQWQCLFRTSEDIWGPKWQVDILPWTDITAFVLLRGFRTAFSNLHMHWQWSNWGSLSFIWFSLCFYCSQWNPEFQISSAITYRSSATWKAPLSMRTVISA